MTEAAFFLLGLILGSAAVYNLCVRKIEQLESELKRAKMVPYKKTTNE